MTPEEAKAKSYMPKVKWNAEKSSLFTGPLARREANGQLASKRYLRKIKWGVETHHEDETKAATLVSL